MERVLPKQLDKTPDMSIKKKDMSTNHMSIITYLGSTVNEYNKKCSSFLLEMDLY